MIRQLEQMTMFSSKFRKFGLIKHKIQKIYFTENLSIFQLLTKPFKGKKGNTQFRHLDHWWKDNFESSKICSFEIKAVFLGDITSVTLLKLPADWESFTPDAWIVDFVKVEGWKKYMKMALRKHNNDLNKFC